jgi:hypothetical protein
VALCDSELMFTRFLIYEQHQIIVIQKLTGNQNRISDRYLVTGKECDEIVRNVITFGKLLGEPRANIKLHIPDERIKYIKNIADSAPLKLSSGAKKISQGSCATFLRFCEDGWTSNSLSDLTSSFCIL